MSQLLSSLRCVSIGRPQSQFFPSKAHRRFPANSAKPGREGRSAACPLLGSPAPRQAPKPPHVSHHSSRENRDELHKGKLKQVKLGKGTETRRKEETKAVSLSTQFPRATAVRERKRRLVLGKNKTEQNNPPVGDTVKKATTRNLQQRRAASARSTTHTAPEGNGSQPLFASPAAPVSCPEGSRALPQTLPQMGARFSIRTFVSAKTPNRRWVKMTKLQLANTEGDKANSQADVSQSFINCIN